MQWVKHTLGDILKRKKTNILIDPEKEYKLVTIKLYHKGVVLRSITKGHLVKSAMFSVKAGDFILSGIDARNGAFGIVPEELDGAIITNDFWCIEPDESKISKAFFLYITSTSFFDYICKQSSDGTTQRIRLQKDRFFSYEIILPTIQEQEELIDKLNFASHQNKIINTELTYQLDLIKQLRQAFLREAMKGKLVKSTNATETGQHLLAQIKAEKAKLVAEKKLKKDKELPSIKDDEVPFEIPEHWVWCRLGEICNYGSSPKAEPKDLNKNTWVLDLEDIEKETSRLISKVRFNERNSLSTKSIFKKGEVLYSKLRPYLDKVIVADEDGVCTTEILPLKLYGEINPKFLKSTLKRSDFLLYVNSITKGMKMPRLGTIDGKMALIPLPPLHEQEKIVSKLEELMTYCDDLEKSIQESQDYNDKLLQQVLREALQPQENIKTISIESRKIENPLKTILAGHIINLNNTTDFGRVKFQKLLFLTEYICKIDFDSNYIKKVAGPYDDALIRNIEADFDRMHFFTVIQDKTDNKRVRYTALDGAIELENLFLENFPNESVRINNILLKFRPLSWGECELIATLYAVWNNRIIKKEPITDELLYSDFMAWDQQKIKYHSIFHKWLFWMKDEKVIPDGWGKYINKPS